jgi:hypothetical protein
MHNKVQRLFTWLWHKLSCESPCTFMCQRLLTWLSHKYVKVNASSCVKDISPDFDINYHVKVNAPSCAKDISPDFDINYHAKVNAPSCAKDLSHDFDINYHVKVREYDQIIIKLWNPIHKINHQTYPLNNYINNSLTISSYKIYFIDRNILNLQKVAHPNTLPSSWC